MRRLRADTKTIDITKTYIEIESAEWRESELVKLEDLIKLLNLDSSISNINLVTFKDQNINRKSPPKNYLAAKNLDLAVDDNYLYVWRDSKWKRVPLSDF